MAVLERIELPAFEEPIEIADELREIEQTSPAKARAVAPDRLADVAWAAWGGTLGSAGLSRDDVRVAFLGMRREIWLWVHGNRVWGQLAGALGARVSRRAA